MTFQSIRGKDKIPYTSKEGEGWNWGQNVVRLLNSRAEDWEAMKRCLKKSEVEGRAASSRPCPTVSHMERWSKDSSDMQEIRTYVFCLGQLLDSLLHQNKGGNHEAGTLWGPTEKISLAEGYPRADSSAAR